MQSDKHAYLHPLLPIAQRAGTLIMHYFHTGHELATKADHSPVTNADLEANTLITEALYDIFPDIPVIAEEGQDLSRLDPASPRFWLVDPLDGTRAFVAGEPEFTVNIALIEAGKPVAGVIYVPATSLLYYGAADSGAFRVTPDGGKIKMHVRPLPSDGMTVVRSKSHPSPRTEAFLRSLHIKELIPGSSSVKFCQVAEGSADIYPRFGRTMEWDTAAGQAILEAAGGYVTTVEGTPLRYGKPGFENPHFIARGHPA